MTELIPAEELSILAQEQADECVSLISSCNVDQAKAYDDGNAALALLHAVGAPWSGDQKATLTTAIRSKVEGSKLKGTGDQQENPFIDEYFPKHVWDVIQSHSTLDVAFEHMSTYCVRVVRLRNPSEKTKRDMVATVFAAREMAITNVAAHVNVEKIN